YAGGSDDIVRAASAQAAFPGASTIAGDHFTILDPAAPGNRTAETVKRHVLADVTGPEDAGEPEAPAGMRTGRAEYVVNAYGTRGLQIGDHNVQHNVFPDDDAGPPPAGRVRADAVILTALAEEHAAVVRALGDCEVQQWRGRRLHVGKIGALEVLAF